jgi:putative FmdB family regulatory protein
MPTYEYVCAKCDHTFEKVQSIKENSLTTCPKENCPRKPWGKGKIKRVVTGGSGLIFKGTGFYETDYRSDSYKAAAKKDAAAGSSSEKKPETSSESKPATPATPSPPAKKEA